MSYNTHFKLLTSLTKRWSRRPTNITIWLSGMPCNTFTVRHKTRDYNQNKEEGKTLKSKQSNTTPDPGQHIGKWQKNKKTSHTREPRGQPFHSRWRTTRLQETYKTAWHETQIKKRSTKEALFWNGHYFYWRTWTCLTVPSFFKTETNNNPHNDWSLNLNFKVIVWKFCVIWA